MRHNHFLFSNIFESEEEAKNNPFVFEKHSLAQRKDDYGDVKYEGALFKKKEGAHELKEHYFIYLEQRLI